MNNEWRRLIEVRNEYHAILSEMLASNRGKLVECANESLRSQRTLHSPLGSRIVHSG